MVLRAFPDSGIKDIGRLKNFAQSTLSPKWNFKITSSQKSMRLPGNMPLNHSQLGRFLQASKKFYFIFYFFCGFTNVRKKILLP
jgi:hypothetical protein